MAAFKPAWKNFFLEKVVTFFTRNLLLFAAVVLAFQIWSAIREQNNKTKTVVFPVIIQTQNDEVSMGTPTPEKVSVVLSGDQSILNNLSPDLQLVLNTRQADRTNMDNITKCTWIVKASDFKVPFGVQVKNFKATKIVVTLDKFISRELPVEPILDEANLPDGFKIGTVTASPVKVTVRGPFSKLNKLTKIRTKPIPLDNITHSFDCDQGFDSEKYTDIDFDRKNVLVQVEILRRNRTRNFKTLPVRILIPSASRQEAMTCEIVSDPTVDLEVSGAENMVNTLRREDIFIFANISEFQKPGLYQIDLRCAIDKNGISAFKITPSKVNVKLERISRR